MSGLGLIRCDEPCWVVEVAEEWGERHFATRADAEASGGDDEARPPRLARRSCGSSRSSRSATRGRLRSSCVRAGSAAGRLRRLAQACWTLACEQCGESYEDEEIGCVHFASGAAAAAEAEAGGWVRVGWRLLCAECLAGLDVGERGEAAWCPPLVVHPDQLALPELEDRQGEGESAGPVSEDGTRG